VDGGLPVVDVVPDPARLAALAAPADRRDWWITRVRACHPLLVQTDKRAGKDEGITPKRRVRGHELVIPLSPAARDTEQGITSKDRP
jgi:hypothetical protein